MKKRQHTKAEDWIPIIEAWEKSSLTKKAFCQQSNISYKTFYRWYRHLYKAELSINPVDKLVTSGFTNFIPVTINKIQQKTLKPEPHCTLLFNDKLQLQIPVAIINAHFLQILMIASGASSC